MSRTRTTMAFAVFDQSGRLQTARATRREAEEAAKIIGGTAWAEAGFTVDPVEITRFTTTSTTHPDRMG